jgi:hypothetical protein
MFSIFLTNQAPVDGSSTSDTNGNVNENPENVQFLTPADELALVKLYINKIPQLCGHFRQVSALIAFLGSWDCYS